MRVFGMHIFKAIISIWSLLASFKICYKFIGMINNDMLIGQQ